MQKYSKILKILSLFYLYIIEVQLLILILFLYFWVIFDKYLATIAKYIVWNACLKNTIELLLLIVQNVPISKSKKNQ